jgi:hypothetical protein
VLIIGGFAGHGFGHGVGVDSSFRRVCHDCGLSWPAEDDDKTRIASTCVTLPRSRPRSATARTVDDVRRGRNLMPERLTGGDPAA